MSAAWQGGDLSADEQLIASSVERLFSEQVDKGVRERAESGALNAALWQQVVNAGFTLVLASVAAGGSAQDWRAAYPILRGIGYWRVPLPLAETALAALLLSAAGLEVPDGPLTLIEQGQGNDLQASGNALSGTAHRVPWARHAAAAVVSLADGDIACLDLKVSGVTVQPQVNAARLPNDTLVLKHARCAALARCPLSLSQPVWTLGAVARCAMLVGALEWALEQSARYAGERVQFGKPIGKNQALQQQLALMAGDVAASRVATLVACADAPGIDSRDTSAATFSAAVAKVRCGEAATRATSIAHQVHGAIGFTHEHALHFATKRLWAWREEFGSDSSWAACLGSAAIAGGAAAFWPAMTRRHFDHPVHTRA